MKNTLKKKFLKMKNIFGGNKLTKIEIDVHTQIIFIKIKKNF